MKTCYRKPRLEIPNPALPTYMSRFRAASASDRIVTDSRSSLCLEELCLSRFRVWHVHQDFWNCISREVWVCRGRVNVVLRYLSYVIIWTFLKPRLFTVMLSVLVLQYLQLGLSGVKAFTDWGNRQLQSKIQESCSVITMFTSRLQDNPSRDIFPPVTPQTFVLNPDSEP